MSILWAYNSSVSIARSVTLIQLFILYFITTNIIQYNNNSWIFRNLYNIIIITGTIISLFVLWQAISLGTVNQWTRVSISDEVDVNHLSAFLIPVFLFSLHYSISKSIKYSISAIVILLAIFATQSRSAFLVVVISVMIYILLSYKIRRNNFKYILICTRIVAISFLVIPNEFTYRIQLMFTNREILTNASGRKIIWGWAWKEFTSNPIAGIGLGNFTVLYRPPHSLFFQILSELGILGIVILGLFVFYLIKYVGNYKVSGVAIEKLIVISLLLMSLTVDIFYQNILDYFRNLVGINTELL